MSSRQTDNSHLVAKINLRIAHLPNKKKIKVLDCFHGDGLIWKRIENEVPDKKIDILGMDSSYDRDGIYLHGDNMKFLKGIELKNFDVIDLDAYGIPMEQLEHVLVYDKKNGLHHTLFITFIQTVYGRLPKKLLKAYGYSEEMIKKCPTLFNKKGLNKLCAYLASYGIKVLYRKSFGTRKHYIYCET